MTRGVACKYKSLKNIGFLEIVLVSVVIETCSVACLKWLVNVRLAEIYKQDSILPVCQCVNSSAVSFLIKVQHVSVCFYMYLSNVVRRPYCAWLGSLGAVGLYYQPLFEKGSRAPPLFSARNVHVRADSREGRYSSLYFNLIRIVSVRLTSVRST